MSKRFGMPKPHARRRTMRRWLDPMNRTRYNHIEQKWEPSANPDCTRGRNSKRFNKRKIQ